MSRNPTDAMTLRPGKHDRQRIRVGLDAHVTVACECGQVWDCGPVGTIGMEGGQIVAMRHALNPNVADPRLDPAKERRKGAAQRSEARAEVVAAWLAKARQRPPD